MHCLSALRRLLEAHDGARSIPQTQVTKTPDHNQDTCDIFL